MPRRSKKSQQYSEMITLYRGDFAKIGRFLLSKTSTSSMLGRGIYLTDDTDIADSYRTKGYHGRNLHQDGLAIGQSSKQRALELAFDRFQHLVDMSGEIHAMPYEFPFSIDAAVDNKDGVYYNRKKSNSIDVEALINPRIKRYIKDIKTEDAKEFFKNLPIRVPLAAMWDKYDLVKEQKKLIDMGYIGIRYDGGSTLGGKSHNAYAIWDEDVLEFFRVKDPSDAG